MLVTVLLGVPFERLTPKAIREIVSANLAMITGAAIAGKQRLVALQQWIAS